MGRSQDRIQQAGQQLRLNGNLITTDQPPNMQLQRLDRLAAECDRYGADPLPFAVSGLFLGWGQRRSRAGAATATGSWKEVVGLGVVGIAHLISILVTVTKTE